ncbi:MAG: hypothetical protein H6867_04760 [Rhodospirillales bacterium]|nr:hypothetical protein [Rhodospirillales bacterium]MCB9994812.1 hypothetical protein [Rhodospirillales bacterium]
MTTKKISELPDAESLGGTELVPVVQDNATRKTTVTGLREGLSADDHTHTLSDITDAGTAAGSAIEDFASAAQGALADSALQPADVGSAAFAETTDFASAAQGALADSAVQPGDLAAVATSGDYDDLTNAPNPGLVNAIINGGCLVSHRASVSLDNTWQYGEVDLLAVTAEGTVSNGTIRQFTGAYSLTQTGAACMVENATLAGSGAILFRHRIESKDARAFVDQAAHFSARAYHDVGSTMDYIITVRKADSEDDFASTTDIDTDTVTVANDTNDTIKFSIADMGDCSNGIEIEVKVDCGAVTTKDFFLAELQFSIGATQKPFEQRPVGFETKLVHRFLRPVTGLVAVANSGSNMQVVLNHPDMRAAPSYEVTAALAFTDGYTADFAQSSAHIGTIHENNKDHGRADIALFSGLTSGRFHIQRGAGGQILASAEF